MGCDYFVVLFDVNTTIAEATPIFLDSFLLRAQRLFSIALHITLLQALSLQHTSIIAIYYTYFTFYLKYLINKLFLEANVVLVGENKNVLLIFLGGD